jgi:hypothetical protein
MGGNGGGDAAGVAEVFTRDRRLQRDQAIATIRPVPSGPGQGNIGK